MFYTIFSCCCLHVHPQILDELYHEDKGFNNNHTVFLSERPPSHDVEHALATHSAARKLSFLQGSPFRTEVGGVGARQGKAGQGRACNHPSFCSICMLLWGASDGVSHPAMEGLQCKL